MQTSRASLSESSTTHPVSARIEAAYDFCEQVVRVHAKNFAYGIAVLPEDQRRALSAIYAYARRVDDIADGDLPRAHKLLQLARAWMTLPWRRRPDPADLVLLALDDVDRRFKLPHDAFDDLLDGVEADAAERVVYDTFGQLVGYCRQVAGSIGRLSVAVFGTRDTDAAMPLADDLGVALQLTNILRDVVEDRERGRVYLPREDLERFGCPPDPLAAPTEALAELIRDAARRNRVWYSRADGLTDLLDTRSAACVTAMTSVYQRILDRIERSPHEVLRGRITLGASDKLDVARAALAALKTDDSKAGA
jgi:15-cis-phytoene synthase